MTSTRGMIELGNRQNLEAAHARRALIPHGPRAHEQKCDRKILAAGAHGGAAPHIHHQRARPVAMILEVAAEQFLGRLLGEHDRRARRHGARIDGVEIAAGGQDVGAAARRRARRTRGHEFAVERGEQRFALAGCRLIEARGESFRGYLRVGLCKRGEELFAAVRDRAHGHKRAAHP